MKLLFLLLLFPAITFAEAPNGDGRYRTDKDGESMFVIDTRTGKVWSKLKGGSGNAIFFPDLFMCGKDKVSFTPNCEKLMDNPTSLSNQQAHE